MDQRSCETPQFVTDEMNIRGFYSAEGQCYVQYSQLYSTSFAITNKSPIELIICLPPSFVHIQCQQTDLHQRQPISLPRVGCLGQNNAQKTMWEHLPLMLEIHQAKTLNSGNRRIKFILHRGIVTCLRSLHFQVLSSFTTLPHST